MIKTFIINTVMLVAILPGITSKAQVKSSSFNFTLKMLLSRDVPKISAKDAAKYSQVFIPGCSGTKGI
jgi:hypothetical protein